MKKFKSVAPLTLTHIQTDNGGEFANHFEIFLEKNGIVHFHTYPRCPKMNTEIERFNRTLSDAFIKQNRNLLAYDIDTLYICVYSYLRHLMKGDVRWKK